MTSTAPGSHFTHCRFKLTYNAGYLLSLALSREQSQLGGGERLFGHRSMIWPGT